MSCSNTRIDRLRACTADLGADAFYVRDQSNLRWLTAFFGVFDDEDAHAMLVAPERAVLHTDSRYDEAFGRAAEGTEIEIDGTRQTHAAFARRVFAGGGSGVIENDASLAIETSIALSEYRALGKAFAEKVREVLN